MNYTPQDFDLPFETFLPNQGEALQAIIEAHHRALNTGEQQFVIVSMPVGGGKTGLTAGMASQDRVTYLADRHALLDQIENNFSFDKIKGKPSYPCVHPEKLAAWKDARGYNGEEMLPTAADCAFKPMRKCPFSDQCEYVQIVQAALNSQKTACTPQLAAFHGGIQQRGGVMFIDEAHNLPEVLGGFIEFNIDDDEIYKFALPKHPFQQGYGEPNDRGVIKGGELTPDGTSEAWLKINDWLTDCIRAMELYTNLEDIMRPQIAGAQRFAERLQRIKDALPTCPWFLQAGPNIMQKRGRYIGGIMLRPLTVANLAPNLWREMDLVVLMSATIGDPEPLAKELGIEKYTFYNFPHPIPVNARPIYDLGFERMTHSILNENPSLYQLQAFKIAQAIKTMPEHWRGLILTSSYEKISKLNEFIPKFLPGRLWKPPKASIGERMAAFLENKKPGIIHVETLAGAGTGFDGRNDILRFVVVAGINHPNPTDPYVQAKKKYNFNLVMGRVFLDVIQASGRATRSEQRGLMDEKTRQKFTSSDFTPEGFLINKTFLADGSAMSSMAQRYYKSTPWFLEAVHHKSA